MRSTTTLFILGSMAVFLSAVKTSAESLPSANQTRPILKDSVNDSKDDMSRLVQVVMTSGEDKDIPNGAAQAIGLSEPMSSKRCHVSIKGSGHLGDDRDIQVVYAVDTPGDEEHHPVCIYLKRGHGAGHDSKSQFFRVSLDGQLEKVVTLQNKLDDDGQPLREGRERFEEDINSPDIQRVFNTEMTYWLKNWLKKQGKLRAKAAPAASAPAPTTP